MTTSGKWVALRLGHMGDVVLATGVLEYLHRTRGWTFVFVTRAQWAPLLENLPSVEEVVGIAEDRLSGAAWREECAELAQRYDGRGLLDLHGVLRSRVLAAAWKAQVCRYPKFSLGRRTYRATRWRWLGDRLARTNVPQRYAMAVEPDPPARSELLPRIVLDPAETARAASFLASAHPGNSEYRANTPLVALHPFATHPNKSWGADRWRELAERLDAQGWHWLVVGAGEPLFPGDPRDFTGRTTLRETCALLARCRALVTGDSGPMHLAGGVGTPVVALFGPTDPAWGFYPAGPADRVLEVDLSCRPCSLHGKRPCARERECLSAITTDQVFKTLAGHAQE